MLLGKEASCTLSGKTVKCLGIRDVEIFVCNINPIVDITHWYLFGFKIGQGDIKEPGGLQVTQLGNVCLLMDNMFLHMAVKITEPSF